MTSRQLTLGHSPDPDDAFMFYGLASGRVDAGGWRFEHILEEIQTLNDWALTGKLDVTAISIHAYPYVAERYALTNCGASMGDGFGPIVVARESLTVEQLRGKTIAVPGERTTAFLALNLLLGRGTFQHKVVMFDRITQEVTDRKVDAGLVIHEGQLTFQRQRLTQVVDLGRWWRDTTGMPLPLGGNCIRRSLGSRAMDVIAGILKRSIEYGLAHRDEAVAHALRYGRGLDEQLTDRFVGMYVNHWTLDYGETGRRAVRELLQKGYEAGMVPSAGPIDFVGE